MKQAKHFFSTADQLSDFMKEFTAGRLDRKQHQLIPECTTHRGISHGKAEVLVMVNRKVYCLSEAFRIVRSTGKTRAATEEEFEKALQRIFYGEPLHPLYRWVGDAIQSSSISQGGAS